MIINPDKWVLDGQAFHGGTFTSAVAAQSGHVQLHNPGVAGEVALWLDVIHVTFVTVTAGLLQNYELRRHDTALTTDSGNQANKNTDHANAPVGDVLSQTSGGILGTFIRTLGWFLPITAVGFQAQLLTIIVDPAIRIAPGEGLLVRNSAAQAIVDVAFEWREA